MKLKLRASLLPALLVGLLMLGLTFVYWQHAEEETSRQRLLAFATAADQAHGALQRRLRSYELTLRGVKGFYEGSVDVDRDAYRSYVDALDLARMQPGLQGLAVAVRVPPAALARHGADMRSRGLAGYRVKPEGERAFYAPITLIEPLSGANLNAPGFDIASNPDVLPALLQARDTGAMALTRKLGLVQDAGADLPAVVMYLPIFARGAAQDSLTARREAIVGWASGPFRLRDLMAGLSPQLDAGVAVEIYQGDVVSPATRLYGLYSPPGAVAASAAATSLHTTRTLALGGQRWTLVLHALPAFEARFHDDRHHGAIAAAGLALSLLLAGLAWLLITGRERALSLALAMTGASRQAQADLARSEEDLAITLSSIADAVIATDAAGGVTRMNPAAERLTGWPLADARGRPLAEVFRTLNAQTRLPSANPVQRVMDSGAVVTLANHTALLARDGHETQIADSAAPIRDAGGNIVGVVLVFSDVSDPYRTEQALRESEARYRAMIEWTPEAIVVHRGGIVIYANPAAVRLSGAASAAELVGQPMLARVHPDFHRVVIERAQALAERRPLLPVIEIRFIRLDGTVIEAESQGTLIDYDGEPAVQVAIHDITERKRADLALQASLQEKTALLHEVHHRVKNNLQVVTSLLRLEARRSAQPETRAVLTDMQGRIRAMALLHESLYRTGVFASVDLGLYLKQIATQAVRLSAGGGAVRLRLELATLVVTMDQAMPFGLLLNELITNAFKHGFADGRSGDLNISLAPLPARGDVSSDASSDTTVDASATWRLCVSDTGAGLPADFAARRGASLGLQLAGDLARQAGGVLDIGPGPQALFGVNFTPAVTSLAHGAP